MMRATSRRALRISLGVSRRSVADWKRRWKRFLIVSLSVSSNCSSLMARYSAGFMMLSSTNGPLANARAPRDESAPERHLVGDPGQGIAGRRLRQTADLVEDHPRPDDRRPVLRLALP